MRDDLASSSLRVNSDDVFLSVLNLETTRDFNDWP